MKKLISLFSFFAIITSSSLSIITCSKPVKQKTIDKVVKKLKDKIINLIVNDGNENSVKNAIKTNSEVIAKLVNLKIKIESFAFIKNGSKFHGTFQNNEEYEVILKIKEEDNKYEKKIKDPVRFKIKIIIVDDQQKINIAVAKLNKIQNKPVELSIVDLSDLTKLQNAVKDLKEYKTAIKHVYLKGDFDLDKTGIIKNGEVITVKGIVKLNDKEATFNFTVIVKEKADLNQKKANNITNNNINNNDSNFTSNITVNDNNSNGENTFQSKITDQNLISTVQPTDKLVDNLSQAKNNNAIPTYQSTSEKTINDFKSKLNVNDNLVKMNLTTSDITEVIEEIAKLNTFDMIIDNENDELVDNLSQPKNNDAISKVQSVLEKANNDPKLKLNVNDNLIKMNLTTIDITEEVTEEIAKINKFNVVIDNKNDKLVDNLSQPKNNDAIPTYQSTSEKTISDFKTKMNLTTSDITEEVIEEIVKLNTFDTIIDNENDELVDNLSQPKYKGALPIYQLASERSINKAKNKLNAIDNLHIKMDLSVANLVEVIQEIKNVNRFNNIVDNKIIALAGNLTLIKDVKNNINFDNNDRFKHGITAYVSGVIFYVEKPAVQATFQFPIKLIDSCKNLINDAKTSLNNIKPSHEVIMNLYGITDKKICEQIKTQINSFKVIVNGEIELDGDLKLTRKNEGKVDIKNGEIVYVWGTIKHLRNEKAKADFKFSIKLVDERQITVDQAKTKLNDIVDYEIFMDLSTVNVEKVVKAIKTDNKFTKIVNNDVIKWDGNLTVAKDQKDNVATNDDFTNGKKLYISGKIKHAFKLSLKANFKSTIILKQIKIS